MIIDRRGRIASCDGVAAGLFGSAPESLLGRDLFGEVAPATFVPAFRGRFLDGVRRGRLDEAFGFVLGAEDGSTDLHVHLRDSGEPDRYVVGLEIRRALPPSRQREAMLAVDLRARAEPVDPLVCEEEPIHVPGTIQASGALLVVDPDSLVIRIASENVADVFGRGVGAVLGHPIDAVLPGDLVAELRQRIFALREQPDEASTSVLTTRVFEFGESARAFAVAAHLHDARLLIEFEAAPAHRGDFAAANQATTADAIRMLRAAPDFGAIVTTAAEIVRELTGFERVLVYRFDAEWNGEAVAESIVEDWAENLIGLRFPASDIPRQARELYRRAPSRFVIDRDAAPVPLVAEPGGDNRPIDLTRTALRSLSPVHVEYQRNLGVNGSMSVAVTIEGRLWGLLIGHHRRPHYVSPETRDAVGALAEALGLRIHDVETAALTREQQRHLDVHIQLLEAMAGADEFVEALTERAVRMTDLFGATGAAIVTGRIGTAIGQAPPMSAILDLAQNLRIRTDGPSIATDHLEGIFPPAAAHRELASGCLAAFIDSERQNLLLWFRPEVAASVVWSGDPTKPVMADAASSAVLPRRSFERWIEERRGYCEPWSPWQVEIAATLARAVEGVALRQSKRVEELGLKQDQLLAALAQKDRLIEQKDLLTREVDHRVKNSLQIVSSFLLLQGRRVADPAAQQAFSDTYARVMSIARVHDSLYQSEDLAEVDLGQTIETLCRDLAGVSGEARELEFKAERGLMVPYRSAVALCLIATELVTNAWKYAYPDSPTGFVEVFVGRHEAGRIKVRVCDDGPGLPPDWDNQTRKGLGMQMIRAMLNQIGGTLEVESRQGTCFTVLC